MPIGYPKRYKTNGPQTVGIKVSSIAEGGAFIACPLTPKRKAKATPGVVTMN